MDQDKYTLHWHTYSDHLRDILKEMSSDDSFADVTLVTDDKKQIKAHRNILSACSSVFKEILQINTNNNHPVIYLRGILYSEMESILQFIYLGEAKFYEERMNEFLTVAKNLDIRELGKSIEDGDSAATNGDDTNIKEEESTIEADDAAEPSKQDIDDATDGQHKTQSKAVTKGYKYECKQCDKAFYGSSTLRRHIKSAHEGVKNACNQCDKYYADQSLLTKHIQSAHEGVKYACNQCDQQCADQNSLKRHIQSIHEGVRYACNRCDQQFTQQSGLMRHIQSIHEGVKYACNQCDHQATTQGHLTRHIQSVHEGVKYTCNQCDYQATERGNLKRHIKSQHIS